MSNEFINIDSANANSSPDTESLAGYTGYGGTDGSYTGRTAGEHDNKAWKTGCEP